MFARREDKSSGCTAHGCDIYVGYSLGAHREKIAFTPGLARQNIRNFNKKEEHQVPLIKDMLFISYAREKQIKKLKEKKEKK